MKKYLLALSLIGVGLMSCQKEISTELPDEPMVPGDTTQPVDSKLLERTVTIDAPDDSTVTLYVYDAKGKVVKITNKSLGEGLENVGYSNTELRFYRNEKGKVERLVEVNDYYEGFELQRTDSSIYEVFHNPVSGQYTHAIHSMALEYYNPTKITKDSLAYTYNANGQIARLLVFRRDEQTNEYFEAKRNEYDYDSKGNIIKMRTNENYDNANRPFTEELIPEYDDKINPQNFGDESLLTEWVSYALPGPNNPAKWIYNSEASEYVYTYNQFDLPESAIHQQGSTVWSITKFYYR